MLLVFALVLAGTPSKELSQAIHELERVILSFENAKGETAAGNIAELYSSARDDLILTQIAEHCRPTIIAAAKALGGKHCGLVLQYELDGTDLIYNKLQLIDLGFKNMFFKRIDELPREMLMVEPRASHLAKNENYNIDIDNTGSDIFVRWIARPAGANSIRDVNDPRIFKDVFRMTNVPANRRISEKDVMLFLLQYNHHYPYYTVSVCNCLKMIQQFFEKLLGMDYTPPYELTTAGKLVQALSSLNRECERHRNHAISEEKKWETQHPYVGGWLDSLNTFGFDRHADVIGNVRTGSAKKLF